MGTVTMRKDSVSASRRGRTVTLHLPLANTGSMPRYVSYRVALFDLSGERLAHRRGKAAVRGGASTINVGMEVDSLADGHAAEAGYVVSYRVEVPDRVYRGKRSLFHLVPKPAISLRAPERAFAGSPMTVPILLTEALRGTPLVGQSVDVAVTDATGKTYSIAALTDGHGTAEVALPALPAGQARIVARGGLPGRMAEAVSAEVEVVAGTRIHLSSDKPLYQPGQTIHMRALILARPDHSPLTDEDVLFEVSDARGNKVFKEVAQTNAFGIVATRFMLAAKVNMGNYKILLTAGDNQVEKTIKVDRYVLPKFKLDLQLDREFYRPGGTLEATVQARYFFGKPVGRAHVKATIFDYQGQWVADREITGEANDEGIFHFEYQLPQRLVGQPVENGDAMMMVNVEVTDTAGQTLSATRQVVVAANSIKAYLIPESGSVVPGVRNHFFVAVTDPGGAPQMGKATVRFTTNAGGSRTRQVAIDATGLGTASFSPPARASQISAEMSFSGDGTVAGQQTFALPVAGGETTVLLRTDRSIVSAGDTLKVEVLASNAISDAFLDVTRDGQTLLTRTITLSNGRGKAQIAIDPAISGTVALSAFVLSARGEFTRDARVVFVHPANELQVTAELDKETYLPGDTARIRFAVADADGPRQAALGIHIVDEALFALSEAQPGLLKLFFALEEELLKPSYQIGRGAGQTLGSLLQQPATATADVRKQRDRSAQAAIAAQGDVAVARQAHSSFAGARDGVRTILDLHGQQLRGQLVEAANQRGKCNHNNGRVANAGEVAERFRRDAWGRSYRKVADSNNLKLHSAGPDRHFDTWDDVQVEIQAWEACPYPRKETRGWGRRWRGEALPMAAATGNIALAAEMDGADRGPEMERPALKKPADEVREKTKSEASTKGGEVRIRKWFPETLFVENALLTDEQGHATVDVPLADSITTWRVSALGSTKDGRLGGQDGSILVFQDFFIDIDFPASLTRNDEVTFPILIYNYLPQAQKVEIVLEEGDWFELYGPGAVEVVVEPDEVTSVSFPVKVTTAGWHTLTVYGLGEVMSDAMAKVTRVKPDGKQFQETRSGVLSDLPIAAEFTYPAGYIENSQGLVVKLIPGIVAQMVEGLDAMLSAPHG